jgi:guanosine-3',5'-bis(diphosphate) 3'-pyrophosphohydrolase
MSATPRRPLFDAASFAARAHDGQYRKDGATPYSAHPFRVCLVVRDLFGFDDPRMLISALLHDTIEDTTTDFDDIAERYGAEIATWVAFLTKDKSLPEEQRERVYIDKLKKAPWQVQVCKLADIFDNASDVLQMPVQRREPSFHRYEQYFAELRLITAPEAKTPIALVQALLDEMRGKIRG